MSFNLSSSKYCLLNYLFIKLSSFRYFRELLNYWDEFNIKPLIEPRCFGFYHLCWLWRLVLLVIGWIFLVLLRSVLVLKWCSFLIWLINWFNLNALCQMNLKIHPFIYLFDIKSHISFYLIIQSSCPLKSPINL